MEIIAKISKNDYLTGIRVFEKGDALSREEIVEAVIKAAEAAEDDGFRGTYVDLPEKYMEYPLLTILSLILRHTLLEQQKQRRKGSMKLVVVIAILMNQEHAINGEALAILMMLSLTAYTVTRSIRSSLIEIQMKKKGSCIAFLSL